MNNKTVQFNCSKCQIPVYRLGVKVNKESQLCGKCNEQPISQALIETKLEPLATHFEHNFDSVEKKIEYYRQQLNKVEELSKTNTTLSFLELWNLAKQ